MEFRSGTCSACKSSFRIPSSFTPNKAKCSKCGGTVEIGPIISDSAGARTHPAAHKAVSAPVAGAAARLAATPGPVPASMGRAASGTGAAGSTSPTRSMGHAPQQGSTFGKSSYAPTPVREVDPHEEERRARMRERRRGGRGMNPVLIVALAVGFPLLFTGAYVAYRFSEDAAEIRKQEDQERAEQIAWLRDQETKKAEAFKAEAKRLADLEKPPPRASSDPAAGEAVKDPNIDPLTGKPKDQANKPPPKAIEGFDTSTIPDFSPYPGTTPQQWTDLQKLAATFMDFSAGAKASVAGYKLEETPKQSFPAILNPFKKLKLEDQTGYLTADATHRLLKRLCPNGNVVWKRQDEADWLKYDQQAIKTWCDIWRDASKDEAYWGRLTRTH